MPRLRIQEMCDKRKISRYRLAQLLGMTAKNLAKLFRPEANPTFNTLCRIAKALKCRVRDLIRE